MLGYILKINQVRDEDLIVTLLTKSRVLTVYRFYGTRHSKIQLGFKLDFEANITSKQISLLSNTSHIASQWLYSRSTFYLWQQICILYAKHLNGIEEIDTYYYNLLDRMSSKLHKQNPKRVFVEGYIELLHHEGRLNQEFTCANCNQSITDTISFGRSFLAFHHHCIYSKSGSFVLKDIQKLFSDKTSIDLENSVIDKLYSILELGI